MAWRLANSLIQLRNQVNQAYPNRNKASDGTIGDSAHASSASDHNPNAYGVVCALDLTHDPANFDAHAFAEHLRHNRHPNLKYIISRARIAGAWTNWQWQPSSGHHQHVHISVGNQGSYDGRSTSNYDSTQDWNINYKGENKDMPAKTGLDTARILAEGILGRDRHETHVLGKYDQDLKANHTGVDLTPGYINSLWTSGEAQAAAQYRKTTKEFFEKYSTIITELEARPTKQRLEEVMLQLEDEVAKVRLAEQKLAEERAKRSEDTLLLDNAGSWLSKLFNRLFKKG